LLCFFCGLWWRVGTSPPTAHSQKITTPNTPLSGFLVTKGWGVVSPSFVTLGPFLLFHHVWGSRVGWGVGGAPQNPTKKPNDTKQKKKTTTKTPAKSPLSLGWPGPLIPTPQKNWPTNRVSWAQKLGVPFGDQGLAFHTKKMGPKKKRVCFGFSLFLSWGTFSLLPFLNLRGNNTQNGWGKLVLGWGGQPWGGWGRGGGVFWTLFGRAGAVWSVFGGVFFWAPSTNFL